MAEYALPVVFAVFVWWFSTGLVLLLDALPHRSFRWSLAVSSLIAAAALWGLAHTAAQTSVAAAYCAFTCALLVWGWHELSFLTGWITGPRKTAAPPGCSEGRRFWLAVQAILWHELALLAAGVAIVTLTWGQPNQVGTATFAVLWVMRISAKLNLFLGVRNLGTEFLPPHLKYLASFFRRRAMNALLPFSVLGGVAVCAALLLQAAHPASAAPTTAGAMLVAALLALAVIEHGFLVMPVPPTMLWRWALKDPPTQMPGPGAAVAPVAAAPSVAEPEPWAHVR